MHIAQLPTADSANVEGCMDVTMPNYSLDHFKGFMIAQTKMHVL